jgi:hypothetical protein
MNENSYLSNYVYFCSFLQGELYQTHLYSQSNLGQEPLFDPAVNPHQLHSITDDKLLRSCRQLRLQK